MTRYVDGFVIPVPRRKLEAYRRLARKASKVWRDHGALDYVECVGDDLKIKGLPGFPRGIRARRGETVVFSWIAYRTRAHRDRVNARAMRDPRLAAMAGPAAMPFDCRRMLYGGFRVIV